MPLTTIQYGMMDSVAQYYGFKNRIINGAMVIDQRNAGASVTNSSGSSFFGPSVFSLDRWALLASQTSKFTIQQNAGSVTPPAGFSFYLGCTSSSAYSVLSGDYFGVGQRVEGFNFADLAWGTASAAPVTLSFWVRSSLTGTFGGAVQNSAQTRSYPFSYIISAANTWEQKTITIPGDTTGTWVGATNGVGLTLMFGIGVGSTFSGTAGAWAGSNFVSATSATSVVGTNGATFYVTGVQLEKGSTATSFDYRPYGTELQLCQRYYQGNLANGNTGTSGNVLFRASSSATGAFYYWMQFPVLMRAAPTMNIGTPTYLNASGAGFFNAAPGGAEIAFTASSGGGYAFIPWRAEIEL